MTSLFFIFFFKLRRKSKFRSLDCSFSLLVKRETYTYVALEVQLSLWVFKCTYVSSYPERQKHSDVVVAQQLGNRATMASLISHLIPSSFPLAFPFVLVT